jgi:regulator of cell morphogenesis and NO signaling
MSHSALTDTRAGSVGDWASRSFRAVLVVEKYGIDFHEEAGRSLEEACAERGLNAEAVRAELEAAAAPRLQPGGAFEKENLREVIRHIISWHHEYLKLELPRLRARLNRMASRHGERDGRLLERLHAAFCELQADLEEHLHKEEMILFPFIERYDSAAERGEPAPAPPFGTVANPIRCMESEHSKVQELLAEMRAITREYVPGSYACANYIAVFRALEELEADLKEHIRVENDVLHRRAEELERRLFG